MSPQPLSALESAFLGLESPDVPFVYACVLELDRAVAVDALREHIARVLADVPRYRQRIVRGRFGKRLWVDDDFDVTRHVHALRVPAPGGGRELHRLVGELLERDIPRDHAPWRLWTVQGLTGGHGAVIALVHHSLVDGVAGVRLLEHILGAAPAEEPVSVPRRRSKLVAVRRLARWHNATALVRLLREGLSPASQLGLNPRHTGRERAVASYTTKLGDIKAIQEAFDVTNNDVVLAAVAGALDAFLARRGIARDALGDVRAMVPVGRHGKDDATSGNKVVLLLVPLPVKADDPLDRLLRTSAATRGIKSGHTASGGDLLVALSDATHPALLTGVLQLALAMRAFNVLVTNVPGPRVRLSLLGARMTRMVPIVNLWPHQSLGIAVATYASTITFGLQADRHVISEHELEELRDDLARELHVLVEAAHQEHAA